MKRYDERDALFSRMARTIGTPAYDDYYATHTHKKESDDLLRKQPPMGTKESRFYHPLVSPMIHSTFNLLSDLSGFCEGNGLSSKTNDLDPQETTAYIHDLAFLYGAFKIGITPYSSDYYYTHKGRKDETYGLPITEKLPFTIIFAVEMNKELFMQSPKVHESIAVTKGYLDAGIIGLVLTYYIQSLGYNARNHMDGNYQMVLPLAAKYAGIGDIGRNGLLATPEIGSRIRLGAVSTDLPLLLSTPDDFSMTEYCNTCKRCGKICPSKAISIDERSLITFDNKWSIDHEKCYAKWQEFGSDCGLCIAQCPFSSPDLTVSKRKWFE